MLLLLPRSPDSSGYPEKMIKCHWLWMWYISIDDLCGDIFNRYVLGTEEFQGLRGFLKLVDEVSPRPHTPVSCFASWFLLWVWDRKTPSFVHSSRPHLWFRGYEVMIEDRVWWTEQDFCHSKENKLLYRWWCVLVCVWWRVGGVPLRLEVKELPCSSSWAQELSRISFLSPQCKVTQYDHSEP